MRRSLSASRVRSRVLAAGALALFSGAGLIAAGSTGHAAAAVAPHPAVTGHIIARHMSTLPPTSYCLANFGINCYTPAQYRKAYDMAPLYAQGLTGAGRAIVIVDAFGSPTIANDLHVFDQKFGLPDAPSLKVIQPAGQVPAFDPNNGDMVNWALETSLDVEWAHAMAPGANILLVETPVSETEGVQGFPEIVKAENYVVDHNLGDVISQSFGATEQTFPNAASLLNLRSAFINAQKHDVTVLGASGDFGATDYQLNLSDLYTSPVNSWPSSDPLVTSMGGTQLSLDDNGNRLAPDVVWNDCCGAGGGGLSSVFGRPTYQNQVQNVVGTQRGTPDISMSASVFGAAWVYLSFIPGGAGYYLVGGTSEATPIFAGVVAIADQLAGQRLGLLNDRIYKLLQHTDRKTSGLVDVTQGNNSWGPFTNSDGNTYTVQGYNALPGYDLASGVGTIDAAQFVPALVKEKGNS